ncbi:MAG: hypothetical protein JWR19_2442 [Pedosphaera sp.]|nr:hypothetical protein [Pedosphaera sp.]
MMKDDSPTLLVADNGKQPMERLTDSADEYACRERTESGISASSAGMSAPTARRNVQLFEEPGCMLRAGVTLASEEQRVEWNREIRDQRAKAE